MSSSEAQTLSGGALNADILLLALRRPAYIAFNQKDLDKYGASLDNLAPVLAQAKTVWISVRRGCRRRQGKALTMKFVSRPARQNLPR